MGKVQRGRKKDHRANRRVVPKPAIQPRIPIVDNSQAEQAKIEAACELEVYRVLNAGNRKFFEEAEEETQAFLTCQPIFFSDLPEKFALANVPLYSRKHIPFVQCDVCTGYTAKATVSECGHRFCDHCSRISQSRRGVFCQYCRKQFQYNVLGVSEDFLSSLLLSCRCGFEGTLTEIRLHNTTKGGKCRDNRVSLVPLLRPNHNYERNAEWKERSLYLDEVGYHERWSLMPPELFDPEYEKMKKNPALPHAYLDFDSDGMYLGRIYIELHEDVVPKTVAKFLNILKDPKGYRGTEIEFMVPDTFFQVKPMSGYGRTVRDFFEDESFKLKHDRPGAVALTNFGPNSNQSGFYITAVEMPWRDGSNVVFGYVIGTHKIINRICQLAREDGSTARRVKIIGCGIVKDWILPSVFSAFEIFDST